MLQIIVPGPPGARNLLQEPDLLLPIVLEMLQTRRFLLQISQDGPAGSDDLQHAKIEMLQMSHVLLRITVHLLQIKIVLLQVDSYLQQNSGREALTIVPELPIKEAGDPGTLKMLQVGLDLQQNGPEMLQIRRRGGEGRGSGKVIQCWRHGREKIQTGRRNHQQ